MKSLVVSGAGIDFENIAYDLKDDSVGGVYADAPFAGKIALERFGIANAAVAVSLNAREKIVDAANGFAVLCLPVGVFGPRPVMPEFLHATALRRRLRAGCDFARDTDFLGVSSTSMRSW